MSFKKNTNLAPRNERGSMMVLIGAIILGVLLALLFFSLNYVRMLGAHEQQRTAIEAAALAAAKDITNLVVEDPNWGFISLSDVAPKGNYTKAGDNFDLPVQGINTILATSRMDLIIADQFSDPIMQQLAQRDYINAMAAKDLLNQTLAAAVAGGTGQDSDGNTLDPVNDALTAYNSNSVRMLGLNKCTIVPGSLKLTLGTIANEPSSTPIPQPPQYAQMSQPQQQNGFYMPYVDVPYKGKDFVFAATSTDVHLVDFKNVTLQANAVPYQIPTIIICEADEIYKHTDNNGVTSTQVVHAKASAMPACMVDSFPAPGSLQLTFPDGRPNSVTMLQDLLTSGFINNSPADYVLTPPQDDSPPAVMNPFEIVPNASNHPAFGTVMRVAIYDWIRRARFKPNFQGLATAFSTAFNENVPQSSPHAIYFDFAPDGTVATRCAAVSPGTFDVISQNQYFGISGLAVQDGTPLALTAYDVFIKDYCFLPGRIKGGKHAGEPFGQGGDTIAPTGFPTGASWISEGVTQVLQFPVGNAGGAVRPTYQETGTATEIVIRKRSN